MDLGLQGRVALVTAASKGLGRAVAIGLAAEGARVTICARGEAPLQQVAQQIKGASGEVLAVRADVTVREDCERVVAECVARFGRLDILVTNSGGPPAGQFLNFSEDDFRKAIELNFMSALRLAQQSVPHMLRQGGGRIVNIVSIATKQPQADLILSNTSRAAVVGLAKSMANELGKYNILVNNVCPGATLTDRVREVTTARAARENRTVEDVLQDWVRDIPLGRLGTPEEFANVVVFLASDRASYLTGTTLQIDGGTFKGLM